MQHGYKFKGSWEVRPCTCLAVIISTVRLDWEIWQLSVSTWHHRITSPTCLCFSPHLHSAALWVSHLLWPLGVRFFLLLCSFLQRNFKAVLEAELEETLDYEIFYALHKFQDVIFFHIVLKETLFCATIFVGISSLSRGPPKICLNLMYYYWGDSLFINT